MGLLQQAGQTIGTKSSSGGGFLTQSGAKSLGSVTIVPKQSKTAPAKITKIPPPPPTKIESARTIFSNLQKSATNVLSKVNKVAKTKPVKGEGLGAPIGRALQKVPNVDYGTKTQKLFKATNTETKIVNFISNFPSMLAQSYGKSLEMLATANGKKQLKEGAKNLPKTMSEVKAHIDNKEWMKAFEAAFSNPAVSVALDVSDFIPVTALAGLGIKKGSKALLKQVVKEGVEEVGEKVVKEAAKKSLVKDVSKAAKSTAEAVKKPVELKKEPPKLKVESKGVDKLSKEAKNSLQNNKNGIKEGGVERAITEIKAGKKPPIKVRTLEDGTVVLEDGRHHLEAARKLGLKDYPIEDVTKFYNKKEIKKTVQEVIPQTEKAKDYISAKDFADEVYSAKPSNKIGLVDPNKITIRDPIGTGAEYKALKADIVKNGIKEPIRVDATKAPITVDGSQRTAIARELGIKVPVIVNEGDIPGLKTIDEIYTQAAKSVSPAIKPKEVSVPRSQLPVGSKEGTERVSRLEARVTQSLDKTPQEIKDQLGSTYTQMNKKENIAKASEYVVNNTDDAMAVLRGEKEAPQGILKNSIYVAMENQAVGDAALARRLASLQSTRAGQELSILTEIDPDSPVKAMRDIVKVREEAFIKRYGGKKPKEVVDKVVSDIKKKVKAPNKYDWNNFIKSLPTC